MAKTYEPFDAGKLLKAVQTGSASPDEARTAIDLTEAITAARAGTDLTEDQLAVLKAADLIEGEETPDPDAATTPEAEEPPAAEEPLVPVQKAATDLPDPQAVMTAVAQQGATLDVSPILQAMNASYERVAKALETHNDLLDEQNALMAQVVQRSNADGEATVAVQKAVSDLSARLESLTEPGEDGESRILKALQPQIGGALETALQGIGQRVGAVEKVLNSRPHPTNPSRNGATPGSPVLKGLGPSQVTADGDVSYPAAITIIQKAVNLDRHEKSAALNDLQTAVQGDIPLTEVLRQWQIDPAAAGK